MTALKLVSHGLCPYVQRASIALTEKGVAFDRVTVDLSDKPAWFSAMSPLGKVPLLQVGQGENAVVLFESAVILEYLEDTQANPLHPADPLERARHRGWIEYGSVILNSIGRLYNAKTEQDFAEARADLKGRFERLEAELETRDAGPLIDGARFSLVDAVFGPVFRYFDVFEARADLHLLDGLARIGAWRGALSDRASVKTAVDPSYPNALSAFLVRRGTHISSLIDMPAEV